MTLSQLHAVKLWHETHKRESPIEYHAWDGVLTAWVAGWMGEPAALILWWPGAMLGCLLLCMTPTLYVLLRRWLHLAGLLRCDWLGSLGSRR